MFNQLSGINAIIYYAPRIFEMAGFSKADALAQPIYIGAANLLFTLIAMSVIDRFGRKRLLIIGSVGMIVFLGLTAMFFRNADVTSAAGAAAGTAVGAAAGSNNNGSSTANYYNTSPYYYTCWDAYNQRYYSSAVSCSR